MPRPTRFFALRAPGLSVISFSFISSSSLRCDDAHEVLDFRDHAARRGRVLEGRAAVQLVEAKPDQRLTLAVIAADRRTDLLDGDRLIGHLCPPLTHRPRRR